MLTMQTFHSRLFAPTNSRDPYFALLGGLTRCTLAEVNAVKEVMIWELWD